MENRLLSLLAFLQVSASIIIGQEIVRFHEWYSILLFGWFHFLRFSIRDRDWLQRANLPRAYLNLAKQAVFCLDRVWCKEPVSHDLLWRFINHLRNDLSIFEVVFARSFFDLQGCVQKTFSPRRVRVIYIDS